MKDIGLTAMLDPLNIECSFGEGRARTPTTWSLFGKKTGGWTIEVTIPFAGQTPQSKLLLEDEENVQQNNPKKQYVSPFVVSVSTIFALSSQNIDMLVEVPVTLNRAKDHPFDGHFNNDEQQTNNSHNSGH